MVRYSLSELCNILRCVYIAVVHVHSLMHSHNHRHFLVPRGPSRTFLEPLILYTSSFARFARSATSPLFAYMTIPAPNISLCRAAAPHDCVRFGYCFPVAVARSLCPLIRYSCSQSPISTAPRLCPLWLLLPDCVRFNCCSSIASTSTAAPRLHPLWLLHPDCIRL